MNRSSWHILTSEYPPVPGGVSDYSRLVALGLTAAGCSVDVWTGGRESDVSQIEGIAVHRLLDRFQTSRLKLLENELSRFDASTLLVQYVPHGFGWKAMNVPLTQWIARQARCRPDVRIMFHEVAFPFVRRPLQHNLLAVVHRWMARTLLRNKPIVYTATSAWDSILNYYAPKPLKTIYLPIPSNIPKADTDAAESVRRKIAKDCPTAKIVGHFGTFGGAIRELTLATLKRLQSRDAHIYVLLIGRGAQHASLEMQKAAPEASTRISAIENATGDDVAAAIKACDVMLQPYPDGISTRRGSAMAALANHVVIVTNEGELAESFWRAEELVAIADAPDPVLLEEQVIRLLRDSGSREKLAETGYDAYRRKFSIESTIEVLLRDSRR